MSPNEPKLWARLPPGARLPATRLFAAELGVSRNIVVAAFEELTSEGYLEGRVGSGTYVVSDLPDLPVNQPATVDFQVSVQASTEVVNVTAEAQTLNTTDATLGNAVNNATIQSLPSEGRNVPELLALQPGVLYLGHDNNQTMDSRSGSVKGARSDQGNTIRKFGQSLQPA